MLVLALQPHTAPPPNSIPPRAGGLFLIHPSQPHVWSFFLCVCYQGHNCCRNAWIPLPVVPLRCLLLCQQKSRSRGGIPPSTQPNTSTPTSLFLSRSRQTPPRTPLHERAMQPPLLSAEHDASFFSSGGYPFLSSQEVTRKRARTREGAWRKRQPYWFLSCTFYNPQV